MTKSNVSIYQLKASRLKCIDFNETRKLYAITNLAGYVKDGEGWFMAPTNAFPTMAGPGGRDLYGTLISIVKSLGHQFIMVMLND